MENKFNAAISAVENPYGPLTPTQLLQRTFSLYRDQPAIVFGLILLFAMAQLITTGAMASCQWMIHSNASVGMNFLQLAFFICLLVLGGSFIYLLTQIVQAAFFYVVTARAEHRTVTVGEACSRALERIVSLMGVSLQIFFRLLGWELLIGAVLGTLAVIVALAAGGAEFIHAATNQQRLHAAIILLPIGLVFLAAFLAAIFWVITRYAIAVPACLAENLSAGSAVRRSISLSAKSRGRIYALYSFVIGIFVLSMVIQIPLMILSVHPGNPGRAHLVFQAVASAVNLLIGSWIISFVGIATSFAYYDLRVRKDGFGVLPATPQVSAARDSVTPADFASPTSEMLDGSQPEYDI